MRHKSGEFEGTDMHEYRIHNYILTHSFSYRLFHLPFIRLLLGAFSLRILYVDTRIGYILEFTV